MNRKTFPVESGGSRRNPPRLFEPGHPESGKCEGAKCVSDANAVREFLSAFLSKEESGLGRDALIKLMEERGRACCRTLTFRRDLIRDSQGDVDKLVELMG